MTFRASRLLRELELALDQLGKVCALSELLPLREANKVSMPPHFHIQHDLPPERFLLIQVNASLIWNVRKKANGPPFGIRDDR